MAQRRTEQVAAEGVDARAHLLDAQLVAAGIALLDDPQHAAVGRLDHPAVAGRVVHHTGQQRRRAAVGDVRGDELLHRLGLQQWRVAREDHHGRLVVEIVAGEHRHAAGGGIAGATLRGLLDEHHVGPPRSQLVDLLGDLLGAVTDDEGRAVGTHALE